MGICGLTGERKLRKYQQIDAFQLAFSLLPHQKAFGSAEVSCHFSQPGRKL